MGIIQLANWRPSETMMVITVKYEWLAHSPAMMPSPTTLYCTSDI